MRLLLAAFIVIYAQNVHFFTSNNGHLGTEISPFGCFWGWNPPWLQGVRRGVSAEFIVYWLRYVRKLI